MKQLVKLWKDRHLTARGLSTTCSIRTTTANEGRGRWAIRIAAGRNDSGRDLSVSSGLVSSSRVL